MAESELGTAQPQLVYKIVKPQFLVVDGFAFSSFLSGSSISLVANVATMIVRTVLIGIVQAEGTR